MCRIVFITGKSVKLPNDYNLKLFAGTVFNHPLKIGTAVGSCRQRTVDVGFNDLNIIFLCKRLTFTQLAFNGLFTLIIRRISRIDYAFYFFSPAFLLRFITQAPLDVNSGVLGHSLTSGECDKRIWIAKFSAC